MNVESYSIYSRHKDALGNPYYSLNQQSISALDDAKRKVISLNRSLNRNHHNYPGAAEAYVLYKEVKTVEEVAVDLDEVIPPQVGPVGQIAQVDEFGFGDEEGDW